MFHEVGNEERADAALEPLNTFRRWKYTVEMDSIAAIPADEEGRAVMQEDAADLIGNLCHLLKRAGVDPKDTMERAFGMFLAEERDEYGDKDLPVVDVDLVERRPRKS